MTLRLVTWLLIAVEVVWARVEATAGSITRTVGTVRRNARVVRDAIGES
jgi:hypothetical protein